VNSLHNVIDVHSHPILPIGKGLPVGHPGNMPDWSIERALSHMEAHGIDACLLSIPDAANHAAGQDGRDIARRINEALAEIVSRHPDRFGALATIPGRDADAVLAEIEYALDTLKLDGVATATSINDVYLGDRQFDLWFAELNRRRATLFVHPTFTKASKPLLNGLNPSVLEFVFDTTRMATNLVVTGAKKRFSDIRIIATHGGGTVPFLAPRIEVLEHTFGVGPGLLELSAEEVREGFASFYYDLTGAASGAQLSALLKLVPASRLLIGLDFPLMPGSSFAPALAGIAEYPEFSADDLHKLSCGNAAELFPALAARMKAGTSRAG